MPIGRFARVLAGFVLPFIAALVLTVPSSLADERIVSFDAEIALAEDGELTVTETIVVEAEGEAIRRGIYRDFPLEFVGEDGRRRRVAFAVESVSRDGEDEPFFTEQSGGVARVYIGDENVLLDPGATYEYALTYRTDRQVRFFETHDELFWNVTGNAWLFPIDRATADIVLPDGVVAEDVEVFTGAFGETGRAAEVARREDGNRITVETSAPLAPEEGLSVAIRLEKGALPSPTAAQERGWYLRDNAGAIIGIVGLVIVFLYYCVAWMLVGRDPPGGVVVPRWDPPDGISPALTTYIEERGFSDSGHKGFAAALVDLAVKGYVRLSGLDRDLTMERTGKQAVASLPVGERAILRKIANKGDRITFDTSDATTVQAMLGGFKKALEDEHRGAFYRHNTLHAVGGAALSILTVLGLVVLGGLSDETLGALIATCIAAVFVAVSVFTVGRAVTRGRGLLRRIIGIIVMAVFGAVGLLVGVTIIASELTAGSSGIVLGVFAAIVFINIVFFFLIGAPTPLGAKRQAGIAGLKQYLRLAEADRMNMAGAPEMSPAHYETLLPYAVALGLEKPWTRAFEGRLATAAAAGAAAYVAPRWYQGGGFDGDSLGGIGASISSGLTAAMPPAESSSSGFSSGGGFSGGGGGGGGGGGW